MKADKKKSLAKLQTIADKDHLTIVPLENPVTNKTNYILVDFTTNGGAEILTWSALESFEEVAEWLADVEK